MLTDYPTRCRESIVLHLVQLYFHFKDVVQKISLALVYCGEPRAAVLLG